MMHQMMYDYRASNIYSFEIVHEQRSFNFLDKVTRDEGKNKQCQRLIFLKKHCAIHLYTASMLVKKCMRVFVIIYMTELNIEANVLRRRSDQEKLH